MLLAIIILAACVFGGLMLIDMLDWEQNYEDDLSPRWLLVLPVLFAAGAWLTCAL